MVWGAIGKRKRTLAIEPEKEPQFNETETTILLPGKNELRLGPLGLRAQPQKTLLENLLTVQTLSGTGYGKEWPSANTFRCGFDGQSTRPTRETVRSQSEHPGHRIPFGASGFARGGDTLAEWCQRPGGRQRPDVSHWRTRRH